MDVDSLALDSEGRLSNNDHWTRHSNLGPTMSDMPPPTPSPWLSPTGPSSDDTMLYNRAICFSS